MVAGGAMGLAAVKLWGSSPVPAGTGNVFTGMGFASFIVALMLIGVACIGIVLSVLGAVLWRIGRARDERMKRTAADHRS